MGLMQRRSVFDRISFPLRSVSDHEAVVRPHFQNYSNRRIGRMVRSGFRSSLEAPRVSPWAPRMLVWRPKKILEQCPENFGQDSVPGINGSSVPAASGDQHFRDLSLSRNNSQIFGISGQKCNRPVGSFPDKFANASWGFPPRLWFRPPLLSLTGGPPHPPSFNSFGLEDLPSDDSVGFFNDIIIPQGVQLQQEEAPAPAEAVLAFPAFPPDNINLEGNNIEGQDDMQIEDNINVGLMLHLDQTIPDHAFEDFMARKCSSSWADLFPDNDGSVSVPKVWAAFFMGLLMRPDSFDWARKFLLSGAISAFVAPSMDTISIRIPPPPSQDSPAKPQPSPQSEATPRKRQPISVDTAVRRSARLRAKAKGFKNCTGIGKKNCPCCTQYAPPTLHLDVIKKLGAEFCKMTPSKLNPEDLNRSKATGTAIQRPIAPPDSMDDESEFSDEQVGDPHFNDDNDDEANTSAGL
ncbi:hypothetical protein ZEAMMB73_Zm00001d019962 [Zea mays]|uniref:Uncharacterized protein n=1 Tax=Zea mays TaxID=4577 RepID=A0A1D6I1A9_MAIZE|nr:hypothetical protein ZEAMMB73_Zm00001d019962 [Zea mays]